MALPRNSKQLLSRHHTFANDTNNENAGVAESFREPSDRCGRKMPIQRRQFSFEAEKQAEDGNNVLDRNSFEPPVD